MPMIRPRTFAVLTATGLALSGQAAQAGTATTTLNVNAIAVQSCTVAALPLAFGTTSQTGTAVDSTATITVVCTPNVAYDIGLDNGANASGGVRRMSSLTTSDFLPYEIYSNAARTQPWGNSVGTDTVSGTVVAAPVVHTAYGRIAANAPGVSAGTYSDSVTVTLTF